MQDEIGEARRHVLDLGKWRLAYAGDGQPTFSFIARWVHVMCHVARERLIRAIIMYQVS